MLVGFIFEVHNAFYREVLRVCNFTQI